jgi:phosphopantetheinyl transferase (holo-ACP synthase)
VAALLRVLFGQPRRVDAGPLLDTTETIQQFCAELRSHCTDNSEKCQKYYRWELWASGFIDALNELEQSIYCSEQFAKRVHQSEQEKMNENELNDYRLHVYFYKNAFIRIFSTLDKTAYFVNDFLNLNTEEKKPRFSYFTVLREMNNQRIHKDLEQPLFKLKTKYQQPLNKLRKRRNLEIHSLNVEMIDDLDIKRHEFHDTYMIEDLEQNSADLEQGFEMVCLSLQTLFTYCKKAVK